MSEVIKLGRHTLIHGDALSDAFVHTAGCALVFDPPYDDEACVNARWECASALVFTDPNRVFTWDTTNPLWVAKTQPLRQSKLCLWLGDGTYSEDGELYGDSPRPHLRKPRKGASGTGGPWKPGFYRPDPRGRHLSTVYRSSKTAMRGHPHAKPDEWVRLLLANCCADQEIVFDPFAGGGSSLMAADALGKSWIGIESDADWCEAIVARYEGRTDIPRFEQLEFQGAA